MVPINTLILFWPNMGRKGFKVLTNLIQLFPILLIPNSRLACPKLERYRGTFPFQWRVLPALQEGCIYLSKIAFNLNLQGQYYLQYCNIVFITCMYKIEFWKTLFDSKTYQVLNKSNT